MYKITICFFYFVCSTQEYQENLRLPELFENHISAEVTEIRTNPIDSKDCVETQENSLDLLSKLVDSFNFNRGVKNKHHPNELESYKTNKKPKNTPTENEFKITQNYLLMLAERESKLKSKKRISKR